MPRRIRGNRPVRGGIVEMVNPGAPKNGEYQEGKFWFERRGSVVTVGLTDSAIEELGEIDSIDFPVEGEDFSKGEVFMTVDGTCGKLEVITPASGVIESINTTAKDEPGVVSEDPLEEGWLVKFEIKDPGDLREFAAQG